MQDETLTVSTCGYKTKKISTFLNTWDYSLKVTSVLECIGGKKQKKNIDFCCIGEVNSWKEELVTDIRGEKHLKDIYTGKVKMKYVEEKKYLGKIVTSNIKNEKNIQGKTNKALGNIRKIEDTLNERPFGIHTYKAAMLLRGGVIVGSLLNNIEARVNVTKSDFKKLEKTD